MVQRHLHVRRHRCHPSNKASPSHVSCIRLSQFDGERDTKGPADFSGNKGEEAADEDEDGDDEDGGSKHKTKSKDHPAIKPKSEQSSNGTIPIRPAHNSAQDFASRNAEVCLFLAAVILGCSRVLSCRSTSGAEWPQARPWVACQYCLSPTSGSRA